MYNQANQEQIVPAMQAQVIVQEIPEFQVVEWIQEQISETIDVIPQESVIQRTTKQIVHVPVPQIQEQSTVTGLVNPHFSTSAVEVPQVAVSFPLSDDFAAPMYNQVHQEQIVATVQPHAIVQKIPEVPVVERIQEQIVEPIEVLPQERVQLHTAIQIVHVPVPQIQEQSAVHNFLSHLLRFHRSLTRFLSRKSLPHPPKCRPSIRAPRRPSVTM